jgi:hypothetical protein
LCEEALELPLASGCKCAEHVVVVLVVVVVVVVVVVNGRVKGKQTQHDVPQDGVLWHRRYNMAHDGVLWHRRYNMAHDGIVTHRKDISSWQDPYQHLGSICCLHVESEDGDM